MAVNPDYFIPEGYVPPAYKMYSIWEFVSYTIALLFLANVIFHAMVEVSMFSTLVLMAICGLAAYGLYREIVTSLQVKREVNQITSGEDYV